MNIKTRINARKVALSYIYQHCFFHHLLTQKSAIVEALFIDNIFQSQSEKFEAGKEMFMKKIKSYVDESFVDNVEPFVDEFFDEWQKEDIDFDYLVKVVPQVEKLESELKEQVNSYTQSFKYDDMDTIDQSLFLLGYAEWKTL